MRWRLLDLNPKREQKNREDPLFRRIRQHADKRLVFEPGQQRSERMESYQEFLRLEREMVLRYHRKGDSGRRVCHAWAIIMDVLIENLFAYALATYKKNHGRVPCKVSTLALGGYGRNELCPYSDIDLMFLYPGRVRAETLKRLQETITEEILYPLWDLKLKVGHATRTYGEAEAEAKANIQSKNAMLEARLICGDGDLFERFVQRFKKFYRRDRPEEYMRDRLQDQTERRRRYGNTVFLQQPNIKNGVGGLRDYQNILWLSYIRFEEGSLEILRQHKILNLREVRELRRAYDFLLRVRNELHFLHGKASDVLDLELQPEVALNLGFEQPDIFERMEAFMQTYFQHADCIYQHSWLLERKLADMHMPGDESVSFAEVIASRQLKREQQFDGFILQDGVLLQAHQKVFEEDPARLIRIFRHAQKAEASLHLDLIMLIRQSVRFLTTKVIHADSPNRAFRSILQTIGRVYPTLDLMHKTGVLGRFLPEFGKLTCLVQHEYYHLYTADIHTLRTIQELDAVFNSDAPEIRHYCKAIRATRTPALLYLMLLLHDLGKAEGIKGHADVSEVLAEPILDRMGVGSEHRKQILFIVKYHFEMARFTLNYDIDDPLTAEAFAKSVGEPDTLRYLYVHTYCDARGTSHDLWNGYKDSILTNLFHQTLRHFQEPGHVEERQAKEREMIQSSLLERGIEGIGLDEIEAHFGLLPDRYFINHSEDEIELHIRMVHDLFSNITQAESVGSLEPVINWQDDRDQGLTIAHIVTWDRSGLFYKLAGAFTVAGLNILTSKVITREDHITIDTFYLTPDLEDGISKNAKETFHKTICESLLENQDLEPLIIEKEKKRRQSLIRKSTQRLRTNITPIVDIYHELALKRTIVEVQGTDHPGLLYLIAHCIYQHGFDINFARISTQNDAALDAFYIENIEKGEPISTARLTQLREALIQIVSQEELPMAG